MTDTQLYLAIGIPSLLALINLGVILVLFTSVNSRIQALDDRLTRSIDNLTGAINDLDKRVIKVEIKLGIHP